MDLKSEYALYLIDIIYNLKNPLAAISDYDDSYYSLTDKFDIEHFVFIANNKYNNKKRILSKLKLI
jgi:hypothetical protein